MFQRHRVIFWGLVVWCCTSVGSAEKDQHHHQQDKSAELVDGDQEIPSENDTSTDIGPPDSHEAMNNREINSKIREKRSYEFLMGLINNNSKYEVTRVDPSPSEKDKEVEITTENIAASEVLLELMVRIAAHPNQWNKVHQLLSKIDHDLNTSRSIVTSLKSAQKSNQTKKQYHPSEDHNPPSTSNNWPTFDYPPEEPPLKKPKTLKGIYPKNFAYHRVTGKPFYLNKNPKAYIAVSVIAPKPMTRGQEDELTLENELQQLKPWTHQQNLKNMATIRSRWLIQTDDDKKASVAPKSV